MAVDESLNALSTTASSNTPAGTDAVGTDLDDHLRDIKKNIRLAAELQQGIVQPTGFRGQLWNDTSRTASSAIVLKWYPHASFQEVLLWDFSASALHQVTHVTPQTTATYDLGTTIRRWRAGYFSNTISVGTINENTSSAGVAVTLLKVSGRVEGSGGANPTIGVSGAAEGTVLAAFNAVTAGGDINFYRGDTNTFNAGAASMKISANSSTSRSINSAGSNNAAGADYAEYEYKSAKCGTVEKGQIIGFDADGKITDRWSAALSFGVKTTNPAYVGGDAWGDADKVGVSEKDPTFAQKYEALRQVVDRIAYSGKVPANVTGAAPGDYLVAVEGASGTIAGKIYAPSDLTFTFDQYRRAVGRVRRVLPDGRAEIAVITH